MDTAIRLSTLATLSTNYLQSFSIYLTSVSVCVSCLAYFASVKYHMLLSDSLLLPPVCHCFTRERASFVSYPVKNAESMS